MLLIPPQGYNRTRMIDPILQALADVDPNMPLLPDDRRYEDFDAIRGGPLRSKISKLMRASEIEDKYAKIAVAGHRGSGKSTELNRVYKDLEGEGYVVLWASVNMNLDPKDISFSDVMRLLVLLIDDKFGPEIGTNPVLKRAFEAVEAWFKEVTVTLQDDIKSVRANSIDSAIGGKVEAEVEAEIGAILVKGKAKARTELGKQQAAINILRRSSSNLQTKTNETLERYSGELVANVNALLRALPQATRTVFILDNVDKYDAKTVNDVFFENADLFRDLDSHLVFTVQSSMRNKPVDHSPDQAIKTLPLPMLPIFQPESRTHNPDVFQHLQGAIEKRVPKSLFADFDQSTRRAIHASGGCWRDLLRILQDALLDANTMVEGKDIDNAIIRVAETYRMLLRDEQDLDMLAKIHITHRLMSDERSLYLLHHLCVLAYNGKFWYDIHPLLEDYDLVKEAISKAKTVKR